VFVAGVNQITKVNMKPLTAILKQTEVITRQIGLGWHFG